MQQTTTKIGRRGVVVIPATMRRRFGFETGDTIIAEERADGVLLRPAVTLPIEIYSPERKAELLLNTTIEAADYERARAAVQAMGLDPDAIPHDRP